VVKFKACLFAGWPIHPSRLVVKARLVSFADSSSLELRNLFGTFISKDDLAGTRYLGQALFAFSQWVHPSGIWPDCGVSRHNHTTEEGSPRLPRPANLHDKQ
jgi:hypothetical protein